MENEHFNAHPFNPNFDGFETRLDQGGRSWLYFIHPSKNIEVSYSTAKFSRRARKSWNQAQILETMMLFLASKIAKTQH